MSTETEALREQFEAWARKNELEAERHKYADDQYDDHAATSAWWAWRDAFQAGHAAAKAETAAVGARGISLARERRDQADFDEAESVFGGGSRTRELMREAADALHAGAEERGE